MRSRTAKFSPVSTEWPAEYRNEQSPLTEEETFATRDSALLPRLLADDSMLVDGYGEQFTGRTWLARLSETKESPVKVRDFRLLHQGDAAVVVGDEVAAPTGLVSRFTRVWTRSPVTVWCKPTIRAGDRTRGSGDLQAFVQQPH